MKKVILSLAAAASVLVIASCGGNETETPAGPTQEQLDSIKLATEQQVKDSIAAEELRIADSTRIADSLIQAGKAEGAKQVTTQTTKKTTSNGGKTTTTTTTKVEPKTPVQESRDRKESKLNDAVEKTQEQVQESRNKKASKL